MIKLTKHIIFDFAHQLDATLDDLTFWEFYHLQNFSLLVMLKKK